MIAKKYPIFTFLPHRVDELEREMKSYGSLQASLQAEQTKRDLIVDQTSRALSMVEKENKTLQQVSCW